MLHSSQAPDPDFMLREGGRQGEREGGREGEREVEAGRERGREGGREVIHCDSTPAGAPYSQVPLLSGQRLSHHQ